MKNLIFLSFAFACFMLLSSSVYSQDTLRLKNRTAIACKVYKISDTEVEYKKWNNLEGPVYTIDKNKVLEIKFQGGSVEKFFADEMDVNAEQQILDKRNTIKFEMFSPVFNKITFGYEHCVKVGWNMEAYASYISTKIVKNGVGGNYFEKSRTNGFALRFGNKFFLGSDYYVKGTKYAHPLKGRFIRVDLSFSSILVNDAYRYASYQDPYTYTWTQKWDKGKINYSQFGLGVSYGRQFILGNMFTLQYNLGINYCGSVAHFEVTEINATPPGGANQWWSPGYFTFPEGSHLELLSVSGLANIARFGELPIGASGNFSIGYIIGGKKKEQPAVPAIK